MSSAKRWPFCFSLNVENLILVLTSAIVGTVQVVLPVTSSGPLTYCSNYTWEAFHFIVIGNPWMENAFRKTFISMIENPWLENALILLNGLMKCGGPITPQAMVFSGMYLQQTHGWFCEAALYGMVITLIFFNMTHEFKLWCVFCDYKILRCVICNIVILDCAMTIKWINHFVTNKWINKC